MRGLKIAVVVMGVMLVAGVTVLVATIASRLSHPRPPPALPGPFAAAPIDLPEGARIETMAVGNDRVVVDIILPDNTRHLVIIDLATGRRLGTVPLRPPP